MKKWENKKICSYAVGVEELDRYGDEGWEVVAVDNGYIYFKREKEKEERQRRNRLVYFGPG